MAIPGFGRRRRGWFVGCGGRDGGVLVNCGRERWGGMMGKSAGHQEDARWFCTSSEGLGVAFDSAPNRVKKSVEDVPMSYRIGFLDLTQEEDLQISQQVYPLKVNRE